MKYQAGQTFSGTRDYYTNGEIVQRTESIEVLSSRISPGMFKFGTNQPVYEIRRTVTVGNDAPAVTTGEISERNLDTFVERDAE